MPMKKEFPDKTASFSPEKMDKTAGNPAGKTDTAKTCLVFEASSPFEPAERHRI